MHLILTDCLFFKRLRPNHLQVIIFLDIATILQLSKSITKKIQSSDRRTLFGILYETIEDASSNRSLVLD